MKALKSFFKIRETYVGIAAALAFQIIFFSVWLTAYDGVFERTDQLKVALVTEDARFGEVVSKAIEEKVPFDSVRVDDLDKAKTEMDERKWNMVIYISDAFTSDIESGNSAKITYLINQSNPSLSKQMMEQTAASLTKAINDEIYVTRQSQITDLITDAVGKEAQEPQKAVPFAEQIISEVHEKSDINTVKPEMIQTNEAEGFVATMIPLMVVLASFIGAMIMSQQLQFAAEKLRSQFGPWRLFLSRQVINVLFTVLLAILTLGIMMFFDIHIETSFQVAWVFQSLLFFSFLTLSQLFVILFGNPGMVFNIALTATQLVSAGAIVPRDMLPSFYQSIGNLLPATYGTNGYFSMIYGGGNLQADIKALLWMTGMTLLIALMIVTIAYLRERKNKRMSKRKVLKHD